MMMKLPKPGLLVGNARSDQFTLCAIASGKPIFDDMAVHRGLLDHVGIIHIVHVCHPTFGVALL
jgi:hypothetical protein